MTQSQSSVSTPLCSTLPASLHTSHNFGRLSAGQCNVVVRLLSGGRKCMLCATDYVLDYVSYWYLFKKNSGDIES
jgi:molybdopterin synthase catalytic subunit